MKLYKDNKFSLQNKKRELTKASSRNYSVCCSQSNFLIIIAEEISLLVKFQVDTI